MDDDFLASVQAALGEAGANNGDASAPQPGFTPLLSADDMQRSRARLDRRKQRKGKEQGQIFPPPTAPRLALDGPLLPLSTLEDRLIQLQAKDGRSGFRVSEAQPTRALRRGAPRVKAREQEVDLCFATHCGDGPRVAELLASGTSVDCADFSGRTPLHIAAAAGYTDLIALLMEARADPNLPGGPASFTALHLAAQAGHTDTLRALLSAGGDLEATTYTASSDRASVATGHTPLSLACQAGHVEAAVCLCEAGADVNGGSHFGLYPVLLAAFTPHASAEERARLVEYLVSRGADWDPEIIDSADEDDDDCEAVDVAGEVAEGASDDGANAEGGGDSTELAVLEPEDASRGLLEGACLEDDEEATLIEEPDGEEVDTQGGGDGPSLVDDSDGDAWEAVEDEITCLSDHPQACIRDALARGLATLKRTLQSGEALDSLLAWPTSPVDSMLEYVTAPPGLLARTPAIETEEEEALSTYEPLDLS
jgi:hypothetical protein